MKIRILSDLHLEFAPWTYRYLGEDLVILAGDISDSTSIGRGRRLRLFNEIDKAGVEAIYVLGNHEGYFSFCSRNELVASIRSELPPNVHLLDRESVHIRGFRILGCVLWTDFSFIDVISFGHNRDGIRIKNLCENQISDFKYLYQSERELGALVPLRAGDMANWHTHDRAWLKQQLTDDFLPTIVITHFLPAPQSIAAPYVGHPLNSYFVTDCRDLITINVKLWIHGHTHHSCDYSLKFARIVCNPRGYKIHGTRENRKFDGGMIVEV